MRVLATFLLATVALVSNASAAFVGGSQITPSTLLSSVSPWTIDQISDGITADDPPYNGFVSTSPTGTITLALDKPYDLAGFMIWNDVHVQAEGIDHFRLDFFDGSSNSLGSTATLQAPQGQFDPASYSFTPVDGVSKVNLVVLDSYQGSHTRIEIREVGFTTVPEPGSLALLGCITCILGSRRRRLKMKGKPLPKDA